MTDLLHKKLTGAIIGAYYEVYNHTSRTYPEYIYERALMEELRRRGYQATCQDEYQIHYKDHLVGLQRLDLMVVEEVMAENKRADRLTPLHKAQGLSYLKTVQKQVGLIFNFGAPQPEFDRLYFDPARLAPQLTDQMAQTYLESSSRLLYPDLTAIIMGGLFEVHNTLGPGYVHRINANACYWEMKLRGLGVRAVKRMEVDYKGTLVGDIAFGHLHVEGKIMVFPVAVGNLSSIRLDNLRTWLRRNDIQLGILANFNALRLEIVFLRV
ncbi:MAG: GxxExxY protein [Anaerolineae bacterium]|nr:GxxExxY protein [Anaerolineae bacterium]